MENKMKLASILKETKSNGFSVYQYLEKSVYPLVKRHIERWTLFKQEAYGQWMWTENSKNQASGVKVYATPYPKAGSSSATVKIEIADDNNKIIRRANFELPLTNDPHSDANAYYTDMTRFFDNIFSGMVQ